MASRNGQGKRSIKDFVPVIVAIIGAVATITASSISYRSGVSEMKMFIQATQTAEAKQPAATQAVVTKEVEVTREVFVTQVVSPTFTPTATPNSALIDSMDNLANWKSGICDDKCGKGNGTAASAIFVSRAPGKTGEAVEVLYDVPDAGWVVITRQLEYKDLVGTNGIGFSFKGIGAPHTIEFKLLLRYPNATEDTTFGLWWKGKTDTGDQWIDAEALYKDFSCWHPAYLCTKYSGILDLTAVKKMDIAISHKPGDTPGVGKVIFDDLAKVIILP